MEARTCKWIAKRFRVMWIITGAVTWQSVSLKEVPKTPKLQRAIHDLQSDLRRCLGLALDRQTEMYFLPVCHLVPLYSCVRHYTGILQAVHHQLLLFFPQTRPQIKCHAQCYFITCWLRVIGVEVFGCTPCPCPEPLRFLYTACNSAQQDTWMRKFGLLFRSALLSVPEIAEALRLGPHCSCCAEHYSESPCKSRLLRLCSPQEGAWIKKRTLYLPYAPSQDVAFDDRQLSVFNNEEFRHSGLNFLESGS